MISMDNKYFRCLIVIGRLSVQMETSAYLSEESETKFEDRMDDVKKKKKKATALWNDKESASEAHFIHQAVYPRSASTRQQQDAGCSSINSHRCQYKQGFLDFSIQSL